MDVNGLLLLARFEEDKSKQKKLLLRAEELAVMKGGVERSSYLLRITKFYLKISNISEAKRCLSILLDCESLSFKAHLSIVSIMLELDDCARAVKFLRTYQEVLREKGASVSHWKELAEKWLFDLHNPKAVDQCLTSGQEVAVSAADYRTLAESRTKLLGDSAGAGELKQLAEKCQETEDRYRSASNKCLKLGEETATTFDDWLTIAWNSDRTDRGTKEIRKALNKANDLADEIWPKTLVAVYFLRYLSDAATATAIFPSFAKSPDDWNKPLRNLSEWEADPAALFEWLRPQITDEMIDTIADSDRGSGYQENLNLLYFIMETGLLPPVKFLHPVLHFTSFSDRSEDVQRAFASLLICIGMPTGYQEPCIIILLESCIILGKDTMHDLLGLMVALSEAADVYNWGAADPQIDEPVIFGLILTAGYINPADERLERLIPFVPFEHVPKLFKEGIRPEKWQELTNEIVPSIIKAQPNSEPLRRLEQFVSL